jgi:hypothetical protein
MLLSEMKDCKSYFILNLISTIVFILLWALDILPNWWYEAMRKLGGGL